LPIWLEFMQQGMAGMPVMDFPNVETLEEQAADHKVHTDVPDTAPEDEAPALPREKPQPTLPPSQPVNTTSTTGPPAPPRQ